MNTLQSEFLDIAGGLLVCGAGLLASMISAFRLKTRDFTLLNFGLFGFLYGLRKLMETGTMQTLVGFPFSAPYFHLLLTYTLVIPFSALLVDLFGRGVFNSMVWVFRSAVVYAVGAVAWDLLGPGPLPDAAIYRPLAVAWGLIWIVNVLLARKKRDIELHVLGVTFLITLVSMIIDQLVSVGVIQWKLDLQQPGFAVLFLGLGFVAAHHFSVGERKLNTIEKEIEIARRIQELNLPSRIRPTGGVEIAARYVPMTTVAGDFYDIRSLDGAGVGMLIADVSGHGIGAALIGSMLKVAFSSQAGNLADPARVLAEINRILQGKMGDSFVTACSVFLDPGIRTLRYAVAGHPPPFLLRKGGLESFRLSSTGTILGPFPDAEFKNEDLRLERTDRLVLFTDGLVETKNRSGELFGDQRLEDSLKACSEESPEISADRIIGDLRKWAGRAGGGWPDDDLTLIVADVLT